MSSINLRKKKKNKEERRRRRKETEVQEFRLNLSAVKP
jgi:hypothetical protein